MAAGAAGSSKGIHPSTPYPPHRYHFRVFALDRKTGLAPTAGCEEVLAAMRGHVLARGELVATYTQRTPPVAP